MNYIVRNYQGLLYVVGANKDLDEAKKHTIKCIRETKDYNHSITSSELIDSKANTIKIKIRMWEDRKNKLATK